MSGSIAKLCPPGSPAPAHQPLLTYPVVNVEDRQARLLATDSTLLPTPDSSYDQSSPSSYRLIRAMMERISDAHGSAKLRRNAHLREIPCKRGKRP